MKRLKKIAIMGLGLLAIAFLLGTQLGGNGGNAKDMEAAEGSSPSTSYQYHLQIFHAF